MDVLPITSHLVSRTFASMGSNTIVVDLRQYTAVFRPQSGARWLAPFPTDMRTEDRAKAVRTRASTSVQKIPQEPDRSMNHDVSMARTFIAATLIRCLSISTWSLTTLGDDGEKMSRWSRGRQCESGRHDFAHLGGQRGSKQGYQNSRAPDHHRNDKCRRAPLTPYCFLAAWRAAFAPPAAKDQMPQ